VAAATGMVVLSFVYVLHLTSVFNRTLMLGGAYIAIISCLGLFVLPDYAKELLSIFPSDSFLTMFNYILVGLVLVISPLFLRMHTGHTAVASSVAPEVPDAPAEQAAETPPAEEATSAPSYNDELQFDAGTFTQSLTNAERKVYELVLLGYSNQQIADELYVSINTIKFHIKNILGKAGLDRKSQLVSYYLKSQNGKA